MHKKDFEKWSFAKKDIHEKRKNNWVRERDIWWCQLGINIGYEQDGTSENFERPVIIIKTFSKFSCLIVPLTTSSKENKFYFNVGMIDGKDASAIISQIRLIDTRRMEEKVGKLNMEIYEKLKKSIQSMIE